jgi:hypothetical protein
VKKGMKVADALEKVAKGYTWCRLSPGPRGRFSVEKLAEAYMGRRGATRRIGKTSAERAAERGRKRKLLGSPRLLAQAEAARRGK